LLHKAPYGSLGAMEQEKTQEKGDALTVYEVSYLLLPSLAVEQVPAKADSVKAILTSAGGVVLGGETPVLIDLAYSMTKVVSTVRHKVSTGYFGWMKFEMDASGMEVVKKNLDADNDILRYLIIKTVKENTLLNGKMKLQKEERARREDEESGEELPEVVKEVAPEELDKSIDELVVA
jgi:ribosomal protein S6